MSEIYPPKHLKGKLDFIVTETDIINVYSWNKAIEAAARLCKEYGTVITVEEAIRKLKK